MSLESFSPALNTPKLAERLMSPLSGLQGDLDAVYTRGDIVVGGPGAVEGVVHTLARENTVLVMGVQFGDEGKGRVTDNKIESLLASGMKAVTVIRYQGGSNAGHTIYTDRGEKVVLHQVPSGILYEEVVGLMDSGMIVHMEDLRTEIKDAEAMEEVGDLRGKLILSPEAMMATDLERAMEVLNRVLSGGKSDGGTSTGISTTVAAAINRTGLEVKDLLDEDWKEKLTRHYDNMETLFKAHEFELSEIEVPDLVETRQQRERVYRKVGSKQEFLDRLDDVRAWFLEREESTEQAKRMIKNTYAYHGDIYRDVEQGIVFEGSQAVGLDPHLGRKPDVTSTGTTANWVMRGTRVPLYAPPYIAEKIGVGKGTYMSSVGKVRMITDSGLGRDYYTEEELASLTADEFHAHWIRTTAKEFGATTGRPRDICWFDLPLLFYNSLAGQLDQLAFTHMDIAKEDVPIKVCTHYEDMQGNVVPYQPGVAHQAGLVPKYIDLPGWDGEAAARARSFDELPENCQKFLAFIQRRMGIPITYATVGPQRDAYMGFN